MSAPTNQNLNEIENNCKNVTTCGTSHVVKQFMNVKCLAWCIPCSAKQTVILPAHILPGLNCCKNSTCHTICRKVTVYLQLTFFWSTWTSDLCTNGIFVFISEFQQWKCNIVIIVTWAKCDQNKFIMCSLILYTDLPEFQVWRQRDPEIVLGLEILHQET